MQYVNYASNENSYQVETSLILLNEEGSKLALRFYHGHEIDVVHETIF